MVGGQVGEGVTFDVSVLKGLPGRVLGEDRGPGRPAYGSLRPTAKANRAAELAAQRVGEVSRTNEGVQVKT